MLTSRSQAAEKPSRYLSAATQVMETGRVEANAVQGSGSESD